MAEVLANQPPAPRPRHQHQPRYALRHARRDGFELEVTLEERADEVIVGVWNSCSSIPASELDAVFKPFVQLGDDRGGTGLGLPIVRRVAQRHGGSAWAESGPDHVHIRLAIPRRTLRNLQ